MRHDPRATFLVERGERWAELCAVMVHADVALLDAGDERDAVEAAITEKYAQLPHRGRAAARRHARRTTRWSRRC